MRKVKEVLRLRYGLWLRLRKIDGSCCISPSGVGDYLERAEAARLTWPLPDDLDEAAIEARLFPPATNRRVHGAPLSDFRRIHEGLRSCRHWTLSLLWLQ